MDKSSAAEDKNVKIDSEKDKKCKKLTKETKEKAKSSMDILEQALLDEIAKEKSDQVQESEDYDED